MLNVRSEFKQAIKNDNRKFEIEAEITLKDHPTNPTVLTITNEELWSQGFEIEDAISSSDSFDIGGFVIGRMRLVINNIYEDYTQYDFFDATVNVTLTLDCGNNVTESVVFNDYTVDEASDNAAQIVLNCLNNAKFFERPYSDSQLTYPATVNQIVANACSVCGVTLLTTSIDGGGFTVSKRPTDEKLTFLKVIAWCAQLTGNYARINNLGQLVVKWFDTSHYESTVLISGAITDTDSLAIKDTDTNAILDANATNSTDNGAEWTIDDSYVQYYHHLESWSDLHTGTDDVVITGIRVVAKDEEGNEVEKTSGNTGYILEIRENELIATSQAQTVADNIAAKVVGMQFRTYTGACLGNPTIECGDLAWVTDRKGRSYRSFVTGHVFKLGQYQSIYCGAKSPSRNSAQSYSAITRAIVNARKAAQRELLSYEARAEALTKLISRGFGMYVTEVEQQDGSMIPYIHDKPTIEQSSYVSYMTSQGVLMEVDGQTTVAVDKNGNALLNTLTARGINADWINTGTIRSKNGAVSINLDHETITLTGFVRATDLGANGSTVIDGARITTGIIQDSQNKNYWNLATGDFSLSATATVGGQTVSTIASNAASSAVDAQTQQSIFNKLTNNGQTQGIYLNAQDNKLYINASYCQTGTMSAERIEGGTLKIGHYGEINSKADVYSLVPVSQNTYEAKVVTRINEVGIHRYDYDYTNNLFKTTGLRDGEIRGYYRANASIDSSATRIGTLDLARKDTIGGQEYSNVSLTADIGWLILRSNYGQIFRCDNEDFFSFRVNGATEVFNIGPDGILKTRGSLNGRDVYMYTGFTGSFSDRNGNTVRVVNGLITTASDL